MLSNEQSISIAAHLRNAINLTICTFFFSGCDDIIRQHKAACLRITALLAVKDILWIGTSAGVVATMHLPHVTQHTGKIAQLPPLVGQSSN
jgi:hypothetical protein